MKLQDCRIAGLQKGRNEEGRNEVRVLFPSEVLPAILPAVLLAILPAILPAILQFCNPAIS
jgi:hypothetical protein